MIEYTDPIATLYEVADSLGAVVDVHPLHVSNVCRKLKVELRDVKTFGYGGRLVYLPSWWSDTFEKSAERLLDEVISGRTLLSNVGGIERVRRMDVYKRVLPRDLSEVGKETGSTVNHQVEADGGPVRTYTGEEPCFHSAKPKRPALTVTGPATIDYSDDGKARLLVFGIALLREGVVGWTFEGLYHVATRMNQHAKLPEWSGEYYEPSPTAKRVPVVGDIVHYHVSLDCFAAIVTHCDGMKVDLVAFQRDSGVWAERGAEYDPRGRHATWHWPSEDPTNR